MTVTHGSPLIFDWNRLEGFEFRHKRDLALNDETLRDGLQSPSVRDPDLPQKIRLLHLMEGLGIASVDLGLPGAGVNAMEHIESLMREIVQNKMRILPNCAVRAVISDIEALLEVSDRVGRPIEAATFIGSSPIRQYVEDWSLERLLRLSEEAVSFAVKRGLPVMYVTEDTTRAHPDTVRQLTLRRGFSIAPADRVLVVEDVVTTGGSTRETMAVARAAGATVVAACSIVDRSGGNQGLDVPYRALLSMDVRTYQPDNCPLCAQGVEVVKPGSRPGAASTTS